MRPVWGTVVLAWLFAGCAAGTSDDDVEVQGLVLEAEEPVAVDWRGPGAGSAATTAGAGFHEPVDLAEGVAGGGLTWSVSEGSWIETSSRVLEREEPSVAADVRPADDATLSAEDDTRRLACEVTVTAPVDRGLRAHGELAVDLVLSDADGREQRRTAERWDLDVELEPGQWVVASTDPLGSVERTAVSQVGCEVTFEPG